MNAENAEALFDAGHTLMEEGRYEAAIRRFNDVIRLRPEMEAAWGHRGCARLEMGRDEEALDDFDMVLRINAEDALGHGFRALALRNLGRYAEALEAAVTAIELAPPEEDCPPARLVRGWLFARAGQLGAAMEDLDAYLDRTEDDCIEPLFELCRDVAEETRTECIDSPSGLLSCRECQCALCGYSFNTAPNPNWRAEGGRCPYSHCIEIMPKRYGWGPGVCPVYGHDCPGGPETVEACEVDPDADDYDGDYPGDYNDSFNVDDAPDADDE
jgi:tetratricopeptide (TPR) repeat protein